MAEVTIRAGRQSLKAFIGDLYRYRELLWTLSLKDIKVRYVQTILGFLWAIINPVLSILILTFIFGRVAGIETGTIPHYIFTIAGYCGWTYFSEVMSSAGNSLLQSQNLIKKIYFPRLIVPLSKAIVALLDFVIILILLFILMIVNGVKFGNYIGFLPLFLLIAIISGLAGGILISALTVRYRDFHHIIPIILRLGMFATPIAYPADAVPEKYLVWFYLNPLAGMVEGFRWSILGTEPPNMLFGISFIMIIVIFILSIFYFKRVEKTMADYI